MDLTPAMKAEIDEMSYVDLLREWRFAAIGDPRFQGPSGLYWRKRMQELRRQGTDHVAASKAVGWDRWLERKSGVEKDAL